jgi:hypothetical protein
MAKKEFWNIDQWAIVKGDGSSSKPDEKAKYLVGIGSCPNRGNAKSHIAAEIVVCTENVVESRSSVYLLGVPAATSTGEPISVSHARAIDMIAMTLVEEVKKELGGASTELRQALGLPGAISGDQVLNNIGISQVELERSAYVKSRAVAEKLINEGLLIV